VNAIVIPDRPIPADLSPAQVADLIDAAATLIDTDGLEIGGYWTEAVLRDYEPGDSVCTLGALAVTCGYRSPVDVEDGFAGLPRYDVDERDFVDGTPHTVWTAALAALGFQRVEDLYDWSDKAGDREVVDALREAAAKIRAGV
jgi:hypothetical protein